MEEIQENEIRAKILPEAGSGEVFGNRQGGDNRQSDGGKKNSSIYGGRIRRARRRKYCLLEDDFS